MPLPEIRMPGALPPFRVSPHNFTLAAPYADVRMATGPARKRRLGTVAPRDLQAELVLMSQAQCTAFHRWFEDVLHAGELEFFAPVRKLGGGRFTLEWWRARFLERGADQPLARGRWRIPCLLRLSGEPSDTPPELTSFSAAIVVPLMARASIDTTYELSADVVVALQAAVVTTLAADILVPLLAAVGNAGTQPDGGDLERIWVRLAATPVPGNEIDRSDQELLQRAWVRW